MATRFDQVMREQGRKPKWLSEQTGYSSSLITLVRQGKRRASPDFRAKVAAALEMDESDLFPEPESAAA